MLTAGTVGHAVADQGKPAFATKPRVTAKGEGARIDFAVAEATDVAVEIVDGKGTVVRHLAAGVLGAKNPPPAPLAPGLTQGIDWDGKDDAGRPAPGPCQVRVRLGLRVEFDRFMVDPKSGMAASGPILPEVAYCAKSALAVDSKGNIHVLLSSGSAGLDGRVENRLIVLSPEGKYLRSTTPYRANTSREKLAGVDFISAEPGRLMPRVYERVSTTMLPQFESMPVQTMTMTADDRLVLTSGWRSELYGFGPRSILILNADGSIPRKQFNGPVLAEGCTGGFVHLGLSPDAKYAYVTGLSDGRYYDPFKDPKTLHHTVLRTELTLDAKPDVFFGKHKTPGAGADLLNDPRGLAVDGKGQVYLSDHMNDRVVVLSPDAKVVREMKITRPLTLVVHPTSGAAYVYTLAGDLVKLDADGKQVWTQRLYAIAGPSNVTQIPSLAIDARAAQPIIYVGSNSFVKRPLVRIVDKGAQCEAKDLIPGESVSLGDVAVVSVTPDDMAYVRQGNGRGGSFLENGATGVRKPWWPRYYDRVFLGRDGLSYTYLCNKPQNGDVKLQRATTARDAVPYDTEDNLTELARSAFWAGRRSTLFVAPDGRCYYLEYLSQGGGKTGIVPFDASGKRGPDLITGLLGPVGVRVDRQGNIFTADNLKPAGFYWPRELDGFISKLDKKGQDEYAESYGTILKFGPKGGAVKPAAASEVGGGARVMELCKGEKRFAVEGLLDCFVGISPVPPLRSDFKSKCWCLGAFFDLDAHDRLFVPDSARFCVHVLDANFNPIMSFGGYDSADAPQGKANRPGPEISFECPQAVNVSDQATYVYDAAPCARRTFRLKLGYAAEQVVAIDRH